MGRRRLRLGDIYEIPLPNGKNAYGRLFKEYTLGIYTKICDSVTELPDTEEYSHFLGVYSDVLREWEVVAHREFENEDDAWAPPQLMVDDITHIGSIYHKGKVIPCTYEECKDLDYVLAHEKHHVIDRIMGTDDWMKVYPRPIDPNNKIPSSELGSHQTVSHVPTEDHKGTPVLSEVPSSIEEYVSISNYDDECVTVSFDCENDKVFAIGEKMNSICEDAYMNGYNWDAFFNYYLAENAPDILVGMDSDPEAGSYSAYYDLNDENEKKAKRFQEIIVSLIENEEEIYHIVREKGSEIEWD